MKFVVKAFLLMVLTFFIFIVQTNSISKEDEHEFIHGLLGSCKNRENGSEDDMKILENMQVPETREGKCMMACVLETIGIFTNNQFSQKTFMFVSEIMAENDPDMMKVAVRVSAECGVLKGERCDLAADFTKCMHSIYETVLVGNKSVEIV